MGLAARLCALVADLHRHGIIHGSLKPTNVIVTESRTGPFPTLLDVGVLPAITHARDHGSGREPEMRAVASERRDVLALGTLLTEVVGRWTDLDLHHAHSAAALASMFP